MLLCFEYLQADERVHLGAQFGTGLLVRLRRFRVNVDGDLLQLALPSSPSFYVRWTKTAAREQDEAPISLDTEIREGRRGGQNYSLGR